jgi:hypothetical protein
MRGFEGVDDLLHGIDLSGKKRADYLVWDRKIIVEQKALVVDPADNPEKFVRDLINEGRLLLYGTTSTRRIFDQMPDGRSLKFRCPAE